MPLKIPPFTPVPIQPTSAEPFSTFVQQTPLAQTPLTGTELVPIIQGGVSKHTPPGSIGGGGSLTVGTTPVASGTSGFALTDNAGVLGDTPIRTILIVDTNFYVATTGSDSNPGTLARPFATLQHAFDVLSAQYDGSGFAGIINVGAGDYSAQVVIQPKPGIGFRYIFLSGAGSGTSTIGAIIAINDILNYPLYYSGFSIKCHPFDACVRVGIGNQLWGAHPDFSTSDVTYIVSSAPAICVWVEGFAFWSDGEGVGTATIGAGTWQNAFFIEPGAQDIQIGDAYTISGTPAFSQSYIICSDSSVVFYGTNTGAATGTRFIVRQNGSIDAGDAAGTIFPGNSAGQILSGGQYSGITDYIGHVAGLPTAIKGATAYVDDSLSPVFSSVAAGGGAVFTPVYGDGTNWRWG